MPLFGSHLSVAGGLYKAAVKAREYGFEALQIFTKAPSQWSAAPLQAEAVAQFQTALAEAKLAPVIVHDSYLINLASPDADLREKSIAAFVDEVERAEAIGAGYLVTHPGSHSGAGEEDGLTRVAQALDEVEARCPDHRVRILLETTAGQGTSLGHRFEHLASILAQVARPEKYGVCFDTCHVFAAGYALSPRSAFRKTMGEFGKLVGLERIDTFHLNDSKKGLGSRVDRHEHIGKGCLGLEPFRLLVNDRRFAKKPMILETAKEVDAVKGDMDTENLRVLTSLLTKRRR